MQMLQKPQNRAVPSGTEIFKARKERKKLNFQAKLKTSSENETFKTRMKISRENEHFNRKYEFQEKLSFSSEPFQEENWPNK